MEGYLALIKEQREENDKLQEEIERLKEENNFLKLNNNELEKYLIEEIKHYEKQIKYYKNNKDLRSGVLDLVGEYEGEKVCFEDMLGKLQELKGDDSNEL